jgi:TRAP-type C4-dicarboxylate transport system permease small subunit
MTSETAQSSPSSGAGSWLDRVLGAAAALLLFGMMVLTAADVTSRKFLNWSLPGSVEITSLLLATLIFAGLPLASRAGEHVTLDFIDLVLGPKGRDVLRRAVDLVCGAIVLALAWRVWIRADRIAASGDITTVLRLPLAPSVYFMTVMLALTGIVHLVRAILRGRPRNGTPRDPEGTGAT